MMIRYFLKENKTAKGSRKRAAADLNGTYTASGPKKTPSTDPGPNSRQVAGGGKEFRCPKCPKAYTTLRAMKNHAASHTETKVPAAAAAPVPAAQKTVVCSVCGDKFSEVRQLNEHLVQAHTSAGSVLGGSGGGGGRGRAVNLRKTRSEAPASMVSAKKQEEDSIRCKECNKKFVSIARLEIHQKKYHGGVPRLTPRQLAEQEEKQAAMNLLECAQCELKFKEQVEINLVFFC